MYNTAELQALGSRNSECPDFCVFKISTVALQNGGVVVGGVHLI